MTIIPHLLLTTLGVQVLGLEGKDIVLAYSFGYGVDIVDHPIKLPLYLKKNGRKNEKHYHWRTPLQEPIALLWIVPLSFYLGTFVPAIFFTAHVFLDYCASYEKRPLYPFSMYSTEGFFPKFSDTIKEVWVCVCCGVLCFALGYHQVVQFITNIFARG
ncbi:MAG: hypothetical protein ABSF91_08970 [Bacteroidota bacterium]|jgi:membrane-bound metal-dependent hydrolase YbcI (DUF457 family)